LILGKISIFGFKYRNRPSLKAIFKTEINASVLSRISMSSCYLHTLCTILLWLTAKRSWTIHVHTQ